MRARAQAAQHAIDPFRIKDGPVRAFGVKKAAQGIVSYVTAASKSPDASEKIRSYSRSVAVSAQNVITRTNRITDLLAKVMRMKTAKERRMRFASGPPQLSGSDAQQGQPTKTAKSAGKSMKGA